MFLKDPVHDVKKEEKPEPARDDGNEEKNGK